MPRHGLPIIRWSAGAFRLRSRTSGGPSDQVGIREALVEGHAETSGPAATRDLLFEADGAPVLVLTSGAHRVDTVKVPAARGTPLRRAEPELVREHTGQVIGGVSPFGHPRPVQTVIDPWLQRHE